MYKGKIYYLFSNIQKYKVLLKTQWIFDVLLSLFIITNLGVHAHLSKCSRGTWPEKGWESLDQSVNIQSTTGSERARVSNLLSYIYKKHFTRVLVDKRECRRVPSIWLLASDLSAFRCSSLQKKIFDAKASTSAAGNS